MPRAKKNIPVSEVLEVMPEEVVATPSKSVENLQPSSSPAEPIADTSEVVKVKKQRAPRKPKEAPLVDVVVSKPTPLVVEKENPQEKPKKTTKEPSELDIKKKLLRDREVALKEKQLALKELELEKKRLRLEAQSKKPVQAPKVVKEEPEYLPDSDDEKIANLKASIQPKPKPQVAAVVSSRPMAPVQSAPKLTPQQILAMGGF